MDCPIEKRLFFRFFHISSFALFFSILPLSSISAFQDDFTKDEVRTMVAGKTPVRREGRADEVADLVVYLASENSSFITVANFDINGGLAFS